MLPHNHAFFIVRSAAKDGLQLRLIQMCFPLLFLTTNLWLVVVLTEPGTFGTPDRKIFFFFFLSS